MSSVRTELTFKFCFNLRARNDNDQSNACNDERIQSYLLPLQQNCSAYTYLSVLHFI